MDWHRCVSHRHRKHQCHPDEQWDVCLQSEGQQGQDLLFVQVQDRNRVEEILQHSFN